MTKELIQQEKRDLKKALAECRISDKDYIEMRKDLLQRAMKEYGWAGKKWVNEV